MTASFDLAIVGAGIAGLAHAHAGARLGKRVVVIDREPQANAASIRGYGLNLVTGQPAGMAWQRALRSNELLRSIGQDAGIPVTRRGLLTVALRPEGLRLCEAYAATDMAAGCQMLMPEAIRKRLPALASPGILGGLWSPHEVSYDPRTFAGSLARWLADAFHVQFLRNTHVRSVFPSRIDTSVGPIRAEAVVVCPGTDLLTLFPHRIANYRLTRSRVAMLRIAAGRRLRLPAAVQSDAGLLSHAGFADLSEAGALAVRLEAERGEGHGQLRMLAVQAADRSLILGDTRQTAPSPEPFLSAKAEVGLLQEFDRLFGLDDRAVLERWTGIHTTADRPLIIDRPTNSVRLVLLTGTFGASMAFAVAEQVMADLFASTTAEASTKRL